MCVSLFVCKTLCKTSNAASPHSQSPLKVMSVPTAEPWANFKKHCPPVGNLPSNFLLKTCLNTRARIHEES